MGIDCFMNFETQLCPRSSQTAYTEMVRTCRWNEFVCVCIVCVEAYNTSRSLCVFVLLISFKPVDTVVD